MALRTTPSGYRQSSFFWPMQFLGTEKRAALQSLYQWCRTVDDAIDEASNNGDALGALSFWETEVNALYTSVPQHQISKTLQDVVQHYSLEQCYFTDMLSGFRMDAEGKSIFPSADEIHDYCYAVASCVGLLALPIFGNTSSTAQNYAIALGHALQRTNILRDIQKDATSGRCYLPYVWFKEASLDLPKIDTLVQRELPNIIRHRLIADARHYYTEAHHCLQQVEDKRSLLPAIMMQEIYATLLERLTTRKGPATPVPRLEKATALIRAIRRSVV